MKLLYKFNFIKGDGKELKLAIRRPTRLEIDDADMMFSIFQSDAIKKGILTKEMLSKAIKNYGGILSSQEEKEYSKIFASYVETRKKLEKAKSKKEKDNLQKELDLYYSSLRDIELEHEHLFSRTADVIARDKTIMHISLLVSMIDLNDTDEGEAQWVPLYQGDEFQDRYNDFCQKELDDTDAEGILAKINRFVTFWYYSDKGVTEKEFQDYDLLTREDFDEIKNP